MLNQQKRKQSFIQEMHAQLLEYQLQKLKKLDLECQDNGERFEKQHNAKEALIDIGSDTDASKLTEEDITIGRWSNYKVPEQVERRYSLNVSSKKHHQHQTSDFKTIPDKQKNAYPQSCRSEKVIPKLKCILHQLEAPLHLPAGFKNNLMKNHFGVQALVISNKEQIKPSLKTQRKRFFCSDSINEGENKRPLSNSSKQKKTISNGYEKIKRPMSRNNGCDLICEKQILSQLIKGNSRPSDATPLRHMLDYFTMSNNDSKKKAENILSLNRLLS